MCICVMMIFLMLICIFVIDSVYQWIFVYCWTCHEKFKLYMHISDIIFLLDTRVKFEETKCKILKEDLCTED
jgi:hypothetical protein